MKCRKTLLALTLLGATLSAGAQKKDFTIKWYGKVEADWYYNSRTNAEGMEGLFLAYPKDKVLDKKGKDLNASQTAGTYVMETRLGMDVQGPEFLGAKSSGKIEFDFRGVGNDFFQLRLRHAYINLDWDKSSLLLGQTWHPLTVSMMPEVINLNAGSPFQPFARAPQLRYVYTDKAFKFTAAALWQSQDVSIAPANNKVGSTATTRSTLPLRNGCFPEVFAGADLRLSPHFTFGAGLHFSHFVPRVISENGTDAYKVSESVNSLTASAHFKYTYNMFSFSGKTVLGQNFTEANGLGGYGITGTDAITGEQKYTPLRTHTVWFNLAYGKTWRPSLYLGYLKNLGASKEVTGVLANGAALDKMTVATLSLTYNRPSWKIGAEYSYTTAWYGDEFDKKHKAVKSHDVGNHRLFLCTAFFF